MAGLATRYRCAARAWSAYRAEHADIIERLLEQHGPDEPTVTLHLTDDVYLRSYNGARVALGLPLPLDGAVRGRRQEPNDREPKGVLETRDWNTLIDWNLRVEATSESNA